MFLFFKAPNPGINNLRIKINGLICIVPHFLPKQIVHSDCASFAKRPGLPQPAFLLSLLKEYVDLVNDVQGKHAN